MKMVRGHIKEGNEVSRYVNLKEMYENVGKWSICIFDRRVKARKLPTVGGEGGLYCKSIKYQAGFGFGFG